MCLRALTRVFAVTRVLTSIWVVTRVLRLNTCLRPGTRVLDLVTRVLRTKHVFSRNTRVNWRKHAH